MRDKPLTPIEKAVIAAAAGMMSIPYFPREKPAQRAILDDLTDLCRTIDEVSWVAKKARHEMTEWRGVAQIKLWLEEHRSAEKARRVARWLPDPECAKCSGTGSVIVKRKGFMGPVEAALLCDCWGDREPRYGEIPDQGDRPGIPAEFADEVRALVVRRQMGAGESR